MSELEALLDEVQCADRDLISISQRLIQNVPTGVVDFENEEYLSACSYVYTISLALIYGIQGTEGDLRNITRRNAINALIRIRAWIETFISTEKDLAIMQSYLLRLQYDFLKEWMQPPQPFLWCNLLYISLAGMLSAGKPKNASTIFSIFEKADYKTPNMTIEQKEQIIHLEFITEFQTELKNILNFALAKRITEEDLVCIIEDTVYSEHITEIRTLGTPKARAQYKGIILDVAENGSTTKRRVQYDEKFGVLCVKKNNKLLPLVPEALWIAFYSRLRKELQGPDSELDSEHDPGSQEVIDAKEMQQRFIEEQQRFEENDD